MTKINYPIGGYAPGNYQNKCIDCGSYFIGDKLACQCEPCAINALLKSHSKCNKEVVAIKEEIQRADKIFSDMENDMHGDHTIAMVKVRNILSKLL